MCVFTNFNWTNAYLHKCCSDKYPFAYVTRTNACLQIFFLDKCLFTQMLFRQMPAFTMLLRQMYFYRNVFGKCLFSKMLLRQMPFAKMSRRRRCRHALRIFLGQKKCCCKMLWQKLPPDFSLPCPTHIFSIKLYPFSSK